MSGDYLSKRRASMERVAVPPVVVTFGEYIRLPNGDYDKRRSPIEDSNSLMAISEGRLRRPVVANGRRFVLLGFSTYDIHRREFEVYEVVDASTFRGKMFTHREKMHYEPPKAKYRTAWGCTGEYARRDPNGFYHGMTAKLAGKAVVVKGPPVLLVAADTVRTNLKQLKLF